LWSIAVSGTGTSVTRLVIPIMAVTLLSASASQMALLTAIGVVPAILFQVVAGMWADAAGNSRIRMMVITDVLAGVLIALVPVLWAAGLLTFGVLIVVMTVKSIVGVCQFAFSSPVIVDVVPSEDLVSANGKASSVRSVTDIAGQALGGALIAAIALPLTLITDAVSFFLSAAMASRIHLVNMPAAPGEGSSRRDQFSVRNVLGIARHLLVRIDLLSLTTIALVGGLTETLIILFCVHTLHIDGSVLGLLIATGAIGGVAGGLVAGQVVTRFGPWAVVIGAAATVLSLLPLPFAGPGVWAGLAVVNAQLSAAFGGTIAASAVFGSIQGDAAEGTVARTMALTSNVLQVSALAGILVGGVVGQDSSPRTGITLGLILLAVMSGVLAVRQALVRQEPRDRSVRADNLERAPGQ
jgi:hypothetical protein